MCVCAQCQPFLISGSTRRAQPTSRRQLCRRPAAALAMVPLSRRVPDARDPTLARAPCHVGASVRQRGGRRGAAAAPAQLGPDQRIGGRAPVVYCSAGHRPSGCRCRAVRARPQTASNLTFRRIYDGSPSPLRERDVICDRPLTGLPAAEHNSSLGNRCTVPHRSPRSADVTDSRGRIVKLSRDLVIGTRRPRGPAVDPGRRPRPRERGPPRGDCGPAVRGAYLR